MCFSLLLPTLGCETLRKKGTRGIGSIWGRWDQTHNLDIEFPLMHRKGLPPGEDARRQIPRIRDKWEVHGQNSYIVRKMIPGIL